MAEAKKYRVKLVTPDERFSLEVRDDETILEATLRAGIFLPHTCLQGWCVSCAGEVLEGCVDQSRALRIFREDEETGFVLLCSAFPRSDLVIQTHRKEIMKEFRIRHRLPVPRG